MHFLRVIMSVRGTIPTRGNNVKRTIGIAILLLTSTACFAAPVTYDIDPNHTYPSFEADHAGLSTFRGKFRATSGVVRLDREARSGDLEVTVDTTSLDFCHDKLNTHAKSADMFNVEKFPTAVYLGRFSKFENDAPTEVDGQLTLHGVTKPVKLTIVKFVCRLDTRRNKEVCGANATGSINRADFGIDFGQKMGFGQDVALVIQVEAIAK